MPQFTKNAIIDVTMLLAQKRPLNKITVRDVVEACGITRNTFYYHFHDIYEVLEAAFDRELDQLKEEWNRTDFEQSMFLLLQFCVTYKSVWNNLYRAVGYDGVASYLRRQLSAVLQEKLKQSVKKSVISEENLHLIGVFYEEALLGIVMRWIREERRVRSSEELLEDISRAKIIFEGTLELTLKNAEEYQKIY